MLSEILPSFLWFRSSLFLYFVFLFVPGYESSTRSMPGHFSQRLVRIELTMSHHPSPCPLCDIPWCPLQLLKIVGQPACLRLQSMCCNQGDAFWVNFGEFCYLWHSLSFPWLVEIHQCSSLSTSLPLYFFPTFAKTTVKVHCCDSEHFASMLVTVGLTVEGLEHTLLLLELAE